ncbi:hypothetical protein V1478_017673 [Vespula squamosa]|uniref:Uncharacterized protein n=1 Tax=Vespula squamosa TaxID=30214 RepID=A0ABD1ZWK1_VESSQ
MNNLWKYPHQLVLNVRLRLISSLSSLLELDTAVLVNQAAFLLLALSYVKLHKSYILCAHLYKIEKVCALELAVVLVVVKNLFASSSLTSSSELFLLDVFFLSRTLDDSELLLRYALYEQLGFGLSSVSNIDFALIAISDIELLVEYGKS